jgi:mono/diheme cytochrome c family protein
MRETWPRISIRFNRSRLETKLAEMTKSVNHFLLLLLATMLLLMACVPPEDEAAPTPDPDLALQDDPAMMIERGEQIYIANCAACHGGDGRGNVANPALAGTEFTLGEPEPVIEVVLHGRGVMPPFRDQLSDQAIADVITYIRNAWGNQASPVTSDQVSEPR